MPLSTSWRRLAANSAASGPAGRRPAWAWADLLREAGDELGIQPVGLGELTDRPGEGADLGRVNDREGRPAAARAAATVISNPPVASSTISSQRSPVKRPLSCSRPAPSRGIAKLSPDGRRSSKSILGNVDADKHAPFPGYGVRCPRLWIRARPVIGTIKARMGATHFLMKTLQRVSTEMALHVLAYNLDPSRTSLWAAANSVSFDFSRHARYTSTSDCEETLVCRFLLLPMTDRGFGCCLTPRSVGAWPTSESNGLSKD